MILTNLRKKYFPRWILPGDFVVAKTVPTVMMEVTLTPSKRIIGFYQGKTRQNECKDWGRVGKFGDESGYGELIFISSMRHTTPEEEFLWKLQN